MRVLVAVTPFRVFQNTCTLLGPTTISRPLRIQCWPNRIPVRWRVACRDIYSNARKLEQVALHTQLLLTISNMKLCRRQVELMLENTQSKVESRWELVLLTLLAAAPLQILNSAPTPKFTTPTSITNELATRRAKLPVRLLVLTLLANEFATVSTKTSPRTIQSLAATPISRAVYTLAPSKSWNRLIGAKTSPNAGVCSRGSPEVWRPRIPSCPNGGVPTRERAEKGACLEGIGSLWRVRMTS